MFWKLVFSVLHHDHTMFLLACYDQMENNLATPTESEETNSASQVVADVLAQKTKKNKFLRNVGIQNG
jgi:hypothetical protein